MPCELILNHATNKQNINKQNKTKMGNENWQVSVRLWVWSAISEKASSSVLTGFRSTGPGCLSLPALTCGEFVENKKTLCRPCPSPGGLGFLAQVTEQESKNFLLSSSHMYTNMWMYYYRKEKDTTDCLHEFEQQYFL